MQRLMRILAMAAVILCMGAQAPQKPNLIKILLITGDDVAVHNWREMSETTREILVGSGKFDVRVSEDPLILESASALKNYDAIVFTIYAEKLGELPAQAKENLLNYVKSGKGFFFQHLAAASFPKWDEFGKLCGRKWVMNSSGHGPRSVFTSKIADKAHPITKGLADFTTDDELYAKLQGNDNIHVLIQADSDWSKKTEPLVFVRNYGQGRVIYNAYGHDRKALMTPTVQKVIIRGTEWAAKGKVTE